MTQPAIQFYHLTTTPIEQALPKLMEKALGQQMRVVVRGNPVQVKRLDEVLWSYDPNSFLPHGTSADPLPQRQPIYLTSTEENPNNASLLVVADGQRYDGGGGFTRVFDIFDGADEDAVNAARFRWKSYKDKDYPLTYIRQKDDGGWEVKMKTGN